MVYFKTICVIQSRFRCSSNARLSLFSEYREILEYSKNHNLNFLCLVGYIRTANYSIQRLTMKEDSTEFLLMNSDRHRWCEIMIVC